MIKRTLLALSGIIFLLVLGVGILRAGEKVTGEEAEKVRSTIETYVKQDSDLKGGFLIYDEKENKVLNLTYDHVHKGVEKTESGEYFACVDFMDSDKNTYDIDVYVDKEGESLNISKMIIHRVNSKDRLKN
ncbi:MAG TPA: hypothetical protein VNN20_14605 [Thermodesulfobacteriota bacterium]|nr:hypothetical protein [Thermodesulfobacteriota bacterium]